MSNAHRRAAERLRANPEQWAVYESADSCAVLAGPGSGKTATLVAKLGRVLREEVRAPRGVACITYSVECVREIEHRLVRLGVHPEPRLFVGTVHGFALSEILALFGPVIGAWPRDRLRKVADARAVDRILQSALDQVRLSDKAAWIRTRFERFRRRTFDMDWLGKCHVDHEMAEVERAYLQELSRAELIDFDTMVIEAAHLLRTHQWARDALRARYPVIIVDEYQDLGPILDCIVREICGPNGSRLLAFGDPDQSVYGFTGAEPGFLVRLAREEWIRRIDLRVNYRSSPQIVALSEAALREHRGYRAATREPGDVKTVVCKDGIEHQAHAIFGKIVPSVVAAGIASQHGEIAILYRDRRHASVFEAAAAAAGIKCSGRDDAAYRRTRAVRWLEDCAEWCSGGWLTDNPRLDAILRVWRNIMDSRAIDDLSSDVPIMRFLWTMRDTTVPARLWLDELYKTGLRASCARNEQWSGEVESLDAFRAAVSASGPLKEWKVLDIAQRRGRSDAVNMMSLHASKGLEFDVAILPELEEGRLPGYRAVTAAELEEERRLFYVGLTRARRLAILVCSGWYEANGRVYRNGPSRFVQELEEHRTRG